MTSSRSGKVLLYPALVQISKGSPTRLMHFPSLDSQTIVTTLHNKMQREKTEAITLIMSPKIHEHENESWYYIYFIWLASYADILWARHVTQGTGGYNCNLSLPGATRCCPLCCHAISMHSCLTYGNLLCQENNTNVFTSDWAVFWYHDCSINW